MSQPTVGAPRRGGTAAAAGRCLLVCLISLVSGPGLCGDEAADPTGPDENETRQIREVLQGLQKWQSLFPAVRITCHELDQSEMLAIDPAFPSDTQPDSPNWGLKSTLWYQTPWRLWYVQRRLVRGRTDYLQEGAVSGFRYWVASGSPENPDQFSHIDVLPLYPVPSPTLYMSRRHPLAEQITPAALRGLWSDSYCCWMGDCLAEREQLRFVGTEEIDGHKCIVLEASEQVFRPIGELQHETWWFDPQQQYLPRKYVRSMPAITIDGEIRPLDLVWTVTEFQQVGSVWFPRQGRMKRDYLRGRSGRFVSQNVEWMISVTSLEQTIPDEQLDPPPSHRATVSYVNEFEPQEPMDWSDFLSGRSPQRGGRSGGHRAWWPDLSTLAVLSVVGIVAAIFVWQCAGHCLRLFRGLRSDSGARLVDSDMTVELLAPPVSDGRSGY
jgi:hypothetical protein